MLTVMALYAVASFAFTAGMLFGLWGAGAHRERE